MVNYIVQDEKLKKIKMLLFSKEDLNVIKSDIKDINNVTKDYYFK